MKRIIVTLLSLLVIAVPIYAQEQFVLSGPDDPIIAISGKVVSEAYQRLGIQVHIKTYPSERAINMSNDGDVDGEVSRIKGIEKTYSNYSWCLWRSMWLKAWCLPKMSRLLSPGGTV